MSSFLGKLRSKRGDDDKDTFVSYKNFENADDQSVSMSTTAKVSGDSDSQSSQNGVHRNYKIIAVTVAVVIVMTAILLVVFLGIGAPGSNSLPTSNNARAGGVKSVPTSLDGSIRITSEVYTSDLNNSASPAYQNLEQRLIQTMEELMVEPGYSMKLRVSGFQEGSVIVKFRADIDGPENAKPDMMVQIFKDSLKSNGNRMGEFSVDPNSFQLTNSISLPTSKPISTTEKMRMRESSVAIMRTLPTLKTTPSTTTPTRTTTAASTTKTTPSTTTPATTTTTATVNPPTNATVIATTTLSSVQSSTTVSSQDGCYPIHNMDCSNALPYNTTTRSIEAQAMYGTSLWPLLQHLEVCSQDTLIKFVMCTYIAPECKSTPEAAVPQSVFMCKHMCHWLYDQCVTNVPDLPAIFKEELFDCQRYVPYGDGDCNYLGSAPATTTTEPNHNLCYPLHNTFCSEVSYSSFFLPNFLGQNSASAIFEKLGEMQRWTSTGNYCDNLLHEYVCALTLPKCENNHRIPPCRHVCEAMSEDCNYYLSTIDPKLHYNCSLLPTTNCIDFTEPKTDLGCNVTSQYPCLSGQCIPLDQRCNGVPECDDLTDERGCENTEECLLEYHKCTHSNGKCIPPTWVCDGYNDCGDESDEVGCSCNDTIEFTCSTRAGNIRCMPMVFRCNGYIECFNGTDEMDCEDFTCVEGQYSCADGQCLPLYLEPECNGASDCRDGSDERNCTCADDEFRCTDGTNTSGGLCVSQDFVCDMARDCSDSSDEKDCPSLCSSSPCKHGGTCRSSKDAYYCICPPQIVGPTCDRPQEMPPTFGCNTNITVDACTNVLAPYHNYTTTSLNNQPTISRLFSFLPPMEELLKCYEHAEVFICQYFLPDCGANQFHNNPCKDMCSEFGKRCGHLFNNTVYSTIFQVFNCDYLFDTQAFPDAPCFSLEHSNPTVAPPEALTPHSEILNNGYCENLTYSLTWMPNYMNQTQQIASYPYLRMVELSYTLYPACHDNLQLFACALFAPQTNANRDGPIPPCRELCTEVTTDCSYWADHVPWTFTYDCSVFPEDTGDADTCVPFIPAKPSEECHSDQFACGSGECFHLSFLCDRYWDCQDGSDEEARLCGYDTMHVYN